MIFDVSNISYEILGAVKYSIFFSLFTLLIADLQFYQATINISRLSILCTKRVDF